MLVSLVTVAKAAHAGVRKGGGSARGPEDRPRSAVAVSVGRLSRAGAERGPDRGPSRELNREPSAKPNREPNEDRTGGRAGNRTRGRVGNRTGV